MTLEIYKITIFLICISIGIQVIEATGIVPDTHSGYADTYRNAGMTGELISLVNYMFDNKIPEQITYLGLTLATFGLLVFTLPFMLALFGFGYFLGVDFITKLFSGELEAGLILLLTIIYIVGYQQYKANISLKQF